MDTIMINDPTTFVSISDTLKIKDTVYFLSDPAFYLSLIIVIIALTALILPTVIQKRKESKKYQQLTKYVHYLLKSLIESINIRIPQIKKLTEQIKDINSGNIIHESILLHSATSLAIINRDDLFKIFILRGKKSQSDDNKHYKSIVDVIEYFLKQDDYNRVNLEKFHTDRKRYSKDFKENINYINRSFDKLVSLHKRENPGIKLPPFLEGFHKILHSLRIDNNQNNYFVAKKVFLKPLKDHAIACYDDENAVQILELVIKCDDALNNLINISQVFGESFNSIIETMKKKRDALQNALNHFKDKNHLSF